MKQSKLIQKAKRFIAGVVALSMTVTMFPAMSVTAAEPQEKYPYTLFAASDAEGAITITGCACVNGNVATNGTVEVGESAINMNGIINENVNEKMMNISAKLEELYFVGDNVEEFSEKFYSEEVNCNISNPTVVDGSMEVKGNVNLNTQVKVSDDITLEVDSINANNAVLYSENGDISISGNNVNFTGLIYAPKGMVSITVQQANLNSVIVIADRIILEIGNANINYNQNMAEIIGVDSQEPEKPTESTTEEITETSTEEVTEGKTETSTEEVTEEVTETSTEETTEEVTETSTEELTEETTEQDMEDIKISLLGTYNENAHSIDMEWYTNAIESDVSIWTSTDNVIYGQEAKVSGVTTYQYVITEEFSTQYFKVSAEDRQGKIWESLPFVVNKTESGYSVNMLDSDGDGVPDEYEIFAGTDVNNPDTDGDTLTDYEELFVINTDATRYDSVTEGISDAEADSDGDKLSNREEIEYVTDAQNVDSDNDTLTDYEEIKVYNTDPLKFDTDGDTLEDGDEIVLGLDPLNPMTFGVSDAEYTVEQTISAESEALTEINTKENPYRLSVDIKAAGYVEGNLVAKETGYAKSVENVFMVGKATELSYANSIEEVTLSFEIDQEYIENSVGLFSEVEELTGIKRFNVFKYFEDINMLLPIETVVDVENNRIYATTDELGTYCVMDMELWLDSFDVPEEVYQEASAMFSLKSDTAIDEPTEEMLVEFSGTLEEVTEVEEIVLATDEEQDVPMTFALNRSANVTKVDIAFMLQASGHLPDTFGEQKTMLVNLFSALNEEYGEGNVRFSIIIYNLDGVKVLKTGTGDTWFISDDDLHSVLDAIVYQKTSGYTDRSTVFQTFQKEVKFEENASKFAFQIMNGSGYINSTYYEEIKSCAMLGINFSEIMPVGGYYASLGLGQLVREAIKSTNGMYTTFGSITPQQIFDHIVTYATPPQIEFEAFVATGWKKIVLDGTLDSLNGINSDADELTDWQEVNTESLGWDTEGKVILPTLKDCLNMVDKPYTGTVFERFLQIKSEEVSNTKAEELVDYVLNSVYVLPLHSDPTDADSDGDGLLDINDPVPMSVKNYDSQYITMDKESDVALIQQCLVHLGYLNMGKNSYGTFGGLTSAAVQLYQVNHRSYEKNKSFIIVDIEDKEEDSGYRRQYSLDRITFYSIIHEAIYRGFTVSDNDEDNIQRIEAAFAFFKQEYIPQSMPLETINVSKNEGNPIYIESVKSELSKEDYAIYVYDLTIPLEGMLRRGAQEFHFYHYQCDAGNSWIDDNSSKCVTYDNSSVKCRKIRTDYIWLFSQVANENRYDVKVENCWYDFFDDLNLEVPYYQSSFPFVFDGEEINAEMFGNILYGYAGHVGGYSCAELAYGGSIYSFITTLKFDNPEDSEMINKGYSRYKEVARDYDYLHITS